MSEFKTRVARVLKQLRLERKMTQHAIAKELGISQQAYQDYENCKKRTLPKLEDFARLKWLYGVSYEYLIGETLVRRNHDIYENFKTAKNLNETLIKRLLEYENEMLELRNTINTLVSALKDMCDAPKRRKA